MVPTIREAESWASSKEFRRAYSGDDTQHYEVAGKQARCPHCFGTNLDTGGALPNTAGLTLLGLDWANRSAHVFDLHRCAGMSTGSCRNPTDSSAGSSAPLVFA